MRMNPFLKLDKAFDHIAEDLFRNLSKQVAYGFLSILWIRYLLRLQYDIEFVRSFLTILHSLTVSVGCNEYFELNILILLHKLFFHPYERADNLEPAEVNI